MFLNVVGTYGVSSAGYWWGRLGAAVLRLVYLLLGNEFFVWLVLFADDWLILAGGSSWREAALLPLLFLRVLGIPLSWKKVSAGFVLSWIGLEVNLREWRQGLSARRAAWVVQWFEETTAKQMIHIAEVRQAVGRLQFAYNVIAWDRPFLAAFYAVISLHPPDAIIKLPVFLAVVISWLREKLLVRRTVPCGRLSPRGDPLFRVDAKADGNDVVVGGWEPFYRSDGRPATELSRWFAIRLTSETAPWAYAKGEPFKAVAALELLATVISLMVFAPKDRSTAGHRLVAVTGQTDSMVSSMVLGKGLTTSFPLNLVAMEAAAQMEARGIVLTLQWLPREVNTEADALSNFRFSGFDSKNRIEIDLKDLPFLVLPRLSESALDFENKALSGARIAGQKRRRPLAPEERLKVRAPW